MTRRPLYYVLDATGEPQPCADVTEWAHWFGAHDAARILAHDVVGPVVVSTVFPGLDAAFRDGPPVLWESMVFGGALDGEQYRYHRRHEAQAGHAQLLQRVREAARADAGADGSSSSSSGAQPGRRPAVATLIRATGHVSEITPANGRAFSLAELQALVGGYLEALYQVDPAGRVMFLNEDGKRLQLPVNHEATRRVRHRIRPDDLVVGDVVICTRAEADGDDHADDPADDADAADSDDDSDEEDA